MNMLEAWKLSISDTASYSCDIGITKFVIAVTCTRNDELTVAIGDKPHKQLTPEDLAFLFRILGIDPEEGWSPV